MIKGHGDDAYHYAEGISSDFSSNICPHGSHQALMAHLASCGERLLAHYPEPEAWSLERLLAQYHDVAPGSVVVTNGATEAIYLVAQAFRLRPVIMGPTFSEYADACRQFPPTDSRHTVCWLCNPNNPTGQVLDQHDVEHLAVKHQLLVIDQSYEHYTDQFVWHPRWACRLPNVILLHSMTKTYGVPGLRLGVMASADRALIDRVKADVAIWNINSFAEFYLQIFGKYEADYRRACHRFIEERRRFERLLRQVSFLRIIPSQANYFCLEVTSRFTSGELTKRLLADYAIMVKDCNSKNYLQDKNYIRVSVRNTEDNDRLVAALMELGALSPHS